MNLLRGVVLAASLIGTLSSCSEQFCGTQPACINLRPQEVQPNGTLSPLTLSAGRSAAVTLTVSREGLPANDAVYILPLIVGSLSGNDTLLFRSKDGLEIHGSQMPFTGETQELTVSTPANLSAGSYEVSSRLRRVASRYTTTSGPASGWVTVP